MHKPVYVRTPLPSKEELEYRFRYEPETGKIFWRNPPKFQAKLKDKEAFGKTEKWGYKVGILEGMTYKAHRVIWKMMTGEEPIEVDHIDGVRANNKFENLRGVDSQANRRNAARSKNNTSGVTGVSWAKHVNKWTAQITVNYRAINLGIYDSFDEAVAVRKKAELEYKFHPNHGR